MRPHPVRTQAGAVDRVTGGNEDEPGQDRRVLLGADVDHGDCERDRDREHEQRRSKSPQGDERGGDREQLDQEQSRLPIATGGVVVEDADPDLQRAHDDYEEDDGERGEDACSHRPAAFLEPEGEHDRDRRGEEAVADERAGAVVVLEDAEQRAVAKSTTKPPM